MQIELPKHVFNLSEYYRMADSGIFAEDAQIELIDGEIVDMSPIGSQHASVVSSLAQTLILQLGNRAIVRVQDPIHLGDVSAPQPDLAIVKAKSDFYRDQHPVADDALLVIEVADSSFEYDLKIKIPLYARHGIAESWLIDLNRNILLQFTESNKKGYRTQKIYHADDVIVPEQLKRVQIKLTHLF